MVLTILSTIFGGIIGYLTFNLMKRKNLFNNKWLIGLFTLMFLSTFIIGVFGFKFNFIAVDSNLGFMPNDKSVLSKYNLTSIPDFKHANILEKPNHPEYINRYYFPLLAVLRKELYSLGDLLGCLAIFILLITMWIIVPFYGVVLGKLPKLILEK